MGMSPPSYNGGKKKSGEERPKKNRRMGQGVLRHCSAAVKAAPIHLVGAVHHERERLNARVHRAVRHFSPHVVVALERRRGVGGLLRRERGAHHHGAYEGRAAHRHPLSTARHGCRHLGRGGADLGCRRELRCPRAFHDLLRCELGGGGGVDGGGFGALPHLRCGGKWIMLSCLPSRCRGISGRTYEDLRDAAF